MRDTPIISTRLLIKRRQVKTVTGEAFFSILYKAT